MTASHKEPEAGGIGQMPLVAGKFFRFRGRIGPRLAACFTLIVVSMIAADAVAVWQFSRTAAAAQLLAEADQISLSVIRVRLDVDTFREYLATVADTHNSRQFTTDAASLRKKFVADVTQSQELIESSARAQEDTAIRSAVETLRGTLPSQIDTAVALASAGNWPALDLQISNQVQAMAHLSTLVVEKVEEAVSQQRAEAIQSGDGARRQLIVILPMAALLTLLVAVVLGRYATRSITDPLSELEFGARALAKGDFQHRVALRGEDEVAEVGRVLNDTARQLASLYEALRGNEVRLRLTIDTIPAFVWSGVTDGSVDFINRRWLEFSGFPLEDALGWGWADAVHPEDRGSFIEAWKAAVGSGAAMEYEARVLRADRQYRWLLIRNVPLHDEEGKVIKWYGTSTDIDDLKRAERALRRSEAYLAGAQKLTHTGTWASDASSRPLYWSEEVFQIFGFDPKHGFPPRDQLLQRVHPDDRDRFSHALQKTIDEKVDAEVEYRVGLPDGTIRHVQALAHPVVNADRAVVEVVGTIVDITERKRAEEERERLGQLEADLAHINRVSMMGELAASIAHEVNQPLSGIVSNASASLRWLNGGAPDLQEIREALGDIVRDGKRAGEVIARIRGLTRRAEAPVQKLDLNETIREVLEIVRDEAKKNNVIIQTRFVDELFPVSGDRVQLQQVLLNLVMNGMEAMGSVGEGKRELLITTANDSDEQIAVSVKDSGIGLSPETAEKIFDPFYTTKASGMGMGLSISRSIIRRHGGRLWATANQGAGTTFHFTLPKYQEQESLAGVAGV
jgi:PAS domain S-box-containing protein